jgi:hypothetical protein
VLLLLCVGHTGFSSLKATCVTAWPFELAVNASPASCYIRYLYPSLCGTQQEMMLQVHARHNFGHSLSSMLPDRCSCSIEPPAVVSVECIVFGGSRRATRRMSRYSSAWCIRVAWLSLAGPVEAFWQLLGGGAGSLCHCRSALAACGSRCVFVCRT